MEPQALGRLLRQTREAKELTLDEAERALRIRRRILELFEGGEFLLPDFAPIQIRGFIRNYARYLGLDEDRIVIFYEEALDELANGRSSLSGRRKRNRARRRPQQAPSSSAPPNGRQSAASASSLSGRASGNLPDDRRGGGLLNLAFRLLVALAAVVIILLGANELLRTDLGGLIAPQASPASVLDAPQALPTFTPLPTVPSATPALELPLQPGFTGQGVLVTIEVVQRTFLLITADGASQYNGVARVGDRLEVAATGTVVITAANAEGVRIVFNGQRQPLFGDRGQRVDLTFTPAGVEVVTGPGFAPTADTPPTVAPTETPSVLIPTPTAQAAALEPSPLPALASPAAAVFIPTSTVGQALPTPLPGAAPLIVPTSTTAPSGGETGLVPPSMMLASASPTPLVLGATAEASPTPLLPLPTGAASATPTTTRTPLPTLTTTPSLTPIPSETPVPSPSAILPPRGTPPGATPTKVR